MFDMTFTEAMYAIIEENTFVQGSDFSWDTYLCNENGVVVTYRFVEDGLVKYEKLMNYFPIDASTLSQGYRIVTVLNRAELQVNRG